MRPAWAIPQVLALTVAAAAPATGAALWQTGCSIGWKLACDVQEDEIYHSVGAEAHRREPVPV
jgi:hypothetical protein